MIEGEAPSLAQIYIHDGTAEGELESHLRHLGETSFPELRGLQVMLHEVNPYVTFFKQGVDFMKHNGDINVRMIFRSDGTLDLRRYNAPPAPEIVAINPGDGYTEGVASLLKLLPQVTIHILCIDVKITIVVSRLTVSD